MRICRYNGDHLGLVSGDKVYDVTSIQDEARALSPYAMNGDAVIAALPKLRARLEEAAANASAMALKEITFLSPIARPSKIIAAPVNYRKHVEEMQARADLNFKWLPKIAEAGLFLKANSSLVGPSEGVRLRFPDRSNEHEAEIVVVIGKEGSDIPRNDALDHVAGYCLGLDMTVRGSEDRSFRKSIDGYSVLGPWMVTAEEIPNPDALPFEFYVNDELRQDSNTSNLVFDVRRLIEFASQFYTLHPGDLIYTGTPDGVGSVKPGDVMRMRCDPIGEMTVAIKAHQIGSHT